MRLTEKLTLMYDILTLLSMTLSVSILAISLFVSNEMYLDVVLYVAARDRRKSLGEENAGCTRMLD